MLEDLINLLRKHVSNSFKEEFEVIRSETLKAIESTSSEDPFGSLIREDKLTGEDILKLIRNVDLLVSSKEMQLFTFIQPPKYYFMMHYNIMFTLNLIMKFRKISFSIKEQDNIYAIYF